MDDMKRAIYMLALEKINKGEEGWVCIALEAALREIMGMGSVAFTDKDRMEFSPEFFTLCDGKRWGRNSKYEEIGSDPFLIAGKSWWKYDWKAPRIEILNYILCQH